MSTVYAEVERLIRAEVRIDAEKFAAANADDRAKFDGTDEEYVRHCVQQDRYEYLGTVGGEGEMGSRSWTTTTK